MLKPSYAELIDVLNQNTGEDNEITSRYTIVIAAAKRARQIISGDKPMVTERKGKPLSTAVNELFNNKIQIVPEGQGTVLNLNLPSKNKPSIQLTNIENDKSNEDFLKEESYDDEEFEDILDDEEMLDTLEEEI